MGGEEHTSAEATSSVPAVISPEEAREEGTGEEDVVVVVDMEKKKKKKKQRKEEDEIEVVEEIKGERLNLSRWE